MHVTSSPTDRLLCRREVEQRVGLAASHIYRAMRRGDFPAPIRVGVTSVRWHAREIEQWIASRPRATGIRKSTHEAKENA